MPYRTPGISKNKLIREARKHPIPTLLLARIPDDKLNGIRISRRGDIEDKINSQNIQISEDACQ